MRIILSICFGVLLFASCTNTPNNEYYITGNIDGKVPAKAYMQYYTDGEMKTIDSSSFVNGEFKFKGSVTAPDYYYLQIGSKNNRMGFFIENSEITITAHIDSIRDMVVSGSATQDQYLEYNELKAVYEDQLRELYSEYRAAENEEQQKEIEIRYDSIDNLKSES